MAAGRVHSVLASDELGGPHPLRSAGNGADAATEEPSEPTIPTMVFRWDTCEHRTLGLLPANPVVHAICTASSASRVEPCPARACPHHAYRPRIFATSLSVLEVRSPQNVPSNRPSPLWPPVCTPATCPRPNPPTLIPFTPGPCAGCSWGSADRGRLGNNMYESSAVPELVPDLDGEEVLQVGRWRRGWLGGGCGVGVGGWVLHVGRGKVMVVLCVEAWFANLCLPYPSNLQLACGLDHSLALIKCQPG